MIIKSVSQWDVISLPSFDPSGRSDFQVVEITTDANGEYVHLKAVSPDGHYVSKQVGVRTMGDTLRNARPAECVECRTNVYVPHNSCLYGGNRTGHSKTHCTANACY